MNQSSVVIEKLDEESLSAVLGGGKTQTFSKVVYVGGLSTTIVSGAASMGCMAAKLICERKNVDPKTCELLGKVAFSAGSLAGLSLLTASVASAGLKPYKEDK